jgi:curved DNA-binding protein CbpA
MAPNDVPVLTPLPEGATAAAPPKVPPSGELLQLGPIRLYAKAVSSDVTGVLTLKLSDCQVRLHFRRGNPEAVDSTHPEDALPAFLLRQGAVTQAQLQQAQSTGGDLLGALVAAGHLRPEVAFEKFSQRAQAILRRALSARAGSFRFEEKDIPSGDGMHLGSRWPLLTDAARHMSLADLKAQMAPLAKLPMAKSGGVAGPTELAMSANELRALSYIDGVATLAQLVTKYPAEAETLLRMTFLLHELDGLVFIGKKATTAAEPAPAAAQAGPAKAAAPKKGAPPPAPAPQLDPQVELAAAKDMAAKMKGKNHFELLGIPLEADATAVKVAYFKLAKQYHPDTVTPGALPELIQYKSALFAAIGEAYRALYDDKSRAEYKENLKSGGADKVDVGLIFLAEEHFQKGIQWVRARKYGDALKAFEAAIAANKEEPEFFAWRGHAKFWAIADKAAARAAALKDIEACLARNPRVPHAHYFRGQIEKATGEKEAALRNFKRAVEIQPDFTDALREIRLLETKR